MSSKRAVRRRMCDGKVRHDDSQTAAVHRRVMQQKNYTGPMNVYRCQFCKGYHIGHRPKNQ